MITHYLQTISARKSICGTKFTKRSHMTMLKNDINCPSCLRLIGERRHYRVHGNQYAVCGVLPAEFSDSRHRVTCEQCMEILNKDIVEAVDEIKTGEGQSHPSPDDGPIEPDKFTVIRTDGGSARGKKHHKCRYWVLVRPSLRMLKRARASCPYYQGRYWNWWPNSRMSRLPSARNVLSMEAPQNDWRIKVDENVVKDRQFKADYPSAWLVCRYLDGQVNAKLNSIDVAGSLAVEFAKFASMDLLEAYCKGLLEGTQAENPVAQWLTHARDVYEYFELGKVMPTL